MRKVLLKTDKEPLMGPNYGALWLRVVAKSEFNSNKITNDELHAIYMLTIKEEGDTLNLFYIFLLRLIDVNTVYFKIIDFHMT